MTKRKVSRDAGDGQFVSPGEAAADPDGTVVESIEYPDPDILLSERDKADLEALANEPDQPVYHTILESWRAILEPALEEGQKRPTPQWCNKIVASYNGLTYADMYLYRDLLFGRLKQLLDLLVEEIASDAECLNYTSAEEDRVENHGHYKNMLFLWQSTILGWELDWDCLNPDAAPDIASISEVHKMIFEPGIGIVQWLDNIKLEFTEADQIEMGQALMEIQNGRAGE